MSGGGVTQSEESSASDVEAGVLRFASVHRFVLLFQVGRLVGDAAAGEAVVEGLVAAGLLGRWRLAPRDSGCLMITAGGLAKIDSKLPLPGLDFGGFRHDAAVPGLWVSVVQGRLGVVRRLWTRRELEASGSSKGGERSLGVRAAGERGVHFADLVLEVEGGLVALYLLLGAPDPARLRSRFTAYGADPRWLRVVHLIEDRVVREPVAAAAASVGLSGLVRCEPAVLG